jgi:cation:H+ antiporter
LTIDLLLTLVLASLAAWLVFRACDWLSTSSRHLAAHYGLPEVVRGSLITATGSSFPEFATVVIATLIHGQFELGFATIVGSALFNILIIPSASTLIRKGALPATRDLVFREGLFYLTAVSVLFLMFAMAVIYAPRAGTPMVGQITRPLAAIPIALYALYIFIQYQEIQDHGAQNSDSPTRIARAWAIFLLAIALIAVGVDLLIRCAINLGNLLDTPSFLWGFTVIAASTSLPDLFISLRASAQRSAVTSIANVFGSNVFDLLIAVPTGILIAGVVSVNFSQIAPLMIVLMLASVAMLVAMRRGLELSNREAVILLTLYVGIVIWIILEAFHIASVFGLVRT